MGKPEDKIRALAYDLWIKDGRQAGKADYYWWTAERRLAESGDLDMSKGDAEVERPPVVAGLRIEQPPRPERPDQPVRGLPVDGHLVLSVDYGRPRRGGPALRSR